jgi:DNA-binding MarR family transcriptional regulator
MTPGRLKDELKKRQPFELIEQQAALNILRTSDQLHNRFGKLFREFGLTGSQYNVLRILRGEGAPMPCLEIASRMIQVVPAMTGLLDRLEAQGLVARERSAEDRRVVYVELTPKGSALLTKLDEPVMGLHRRLMGHFTKRELTELNRLLEKAREKLAEGFP